MGEKALENSLVGILRQSQVKQGILSSVKIINSTSAANSLADLCQDLSFDVLQDDSSWNLHPGFMIDVIGGMTPDIVIRSKSSGQNRICIEVKESSSLNYGTHDSQIVRYFLHLLATSEKDPLGSSDIGRAILLAAPTEWFESTKTGTDWKYFVERYTELARAFNITLGELHLPLIQPTT